MKITDVSVTLFAWDDIPSTRYGGHIAAVGSSDETDAGAVGHAFLGASSRPRSRDAEVVVKLLKPLSSGSAMQPFGGEYVGLEAAEQRHQRDRAGAHLIGQGRQAERHSFPGIALGLPVQRLMPAILSRPGSSPAGWGPPSHGGSTWNGVGGWLMPSRSRQLNLSLTVWITFHWRGIVSSDSVMSSPSLQS
jgi:hypothetical protein